MTETKLNHAMCVARGTCLATIAKEGLSPSTWELLRRDGTLRYGLEADIRRTLTACAARNVRFLIEDLPALSVDPDPAELTYVAEAIGNRVAAQWVAIVDEVMDAEAAKPALRLV
jgi:hypothetical protein